MESRYDVDIEQLLGSYRDQVAQAAETARQVRELRATAVSQRRQVSATVGSQGELLELEFSGDGYRELPPRELAALIIGTVARAREDVMAQVTELVTGSLPPGMDAGKLLSGELDPLAMLSAEPAPASDAVAQYLRHGRPGRRTDEGRPA